MGGAASCGVTTSDFLNLVDSCESEACLIPKSDILCGLSSVPSPPGPLLVLGTCIFSGGGIGTAAGVSALFGGAEGSGFLSSRSESRRDCASPGSCVKKGANVSSFVRDKPRLSLFIEFPRLRAGEGLLSESSPASSIMLLCRRCAERGPALERRVLSGMFGGAGAGLDTLDHLGIARLRGSRLVVGKMLSTWTVQAGCLQGFSVGRPAATERR